MNDSNLSKEYSDISLNFEPHPVTGDLSRITGSMAIRTAIINLVMANFGERHYDVNKGADLRSLMFETYTPMLDGVIQRKIENVLEAYEPRVSLQEVNVNRSKIDVNEIIIEIKYKITANGQDDVVRVELEKAR